MSHSSFTVGVVTSEEFLDAPCLLECTVGLPFTSGGLLRLLLIVIGPPVLAWKTLFLRVWVPAVSLLQAEEKAVN